MTQNNKFKVGDRVRIRSWKSMKEEFGLDRNGHIDCPFGFAKAMRHLCEHTAKISAIQPNGQIYLYSWSDHKGNTNWSFSTDMLEVITTIDLSEICIVGHTVSNILITPSIVQAITNNPTGFEEFNSELLRIEGYYIPRECVVIEEN